MPGAVRIYKGVGGSAHSFYDTDGTVPMLSADTSNTNHGAFPVGRAAKLSTGRSYSYESWIYLYVSGAPDNSIQNVRFWGPNGNRQGTGIVLWVGTSWYGSASAGLYGRPTNNMSTPAILNGASSRAYTAPGDSLLWDDVTETGNNMSQIGSTSAFLVLQLTVDSNAETGTLSSENTVFHFSYDEA